MVAPRTPAAHRIVGLDTMVLIYAFEGSGALGQACTTLLRSIEAGEVEAVMSSLVLAELLVRPLRQNRVDVVERYLDTLARLPHLVQVPADTAVCRLAAELRADAAALRLPDAIHMATAMSQGATALISSDARLRSVAGLEILPPG
jgi:predicted nucleic acid-binding protein